MTTETLSPPAGTPSADPPSTPPGDWMQLMHGGQLWLLDPKPQQISIYEIACCLSRIPRFVGHTHSHLHSYSVAQHSVFVSRLCEMFPLHGLLHDAHEAYTGDLSTPMKRTLEAFLTDLCGENQFGKAWKTITRKLDRAIAAALIPGNDPDNAIHFSGGEVGHADLIALATEKRDLMAPEPAPWRLDGISPAVEVILPVEAKTAERMFLARYRELTGGRGQ